MEPEQSKTQDPDVLLDVRHLTKSFVAASNFFGKPTSFVRAVDDVSFSRRAGRSSSKGPSSRSFP